MFEPLDGPSSQDLIAITNVAITEVKVGASAFSERKIITLQPTANIKVYFAGNTTPTLSDVLNKGFLQYKDQFMTYEAGPQQKVYIASVGASANVVIAERA